MSKLGRACTERKMMGLDKHVCLGRATALAVCRGTQPLGPTNKGHRPPSFIYLRGLRCQHDASGAAWGSERTEGCCWPVHRRESKLLWGGQDKAKARKDGVWVLAAFLGVRPPM